MNESIVPTPTSKTLQDLVAERNDRFLLFLFLFLLFNLDSFQHCSKKKRKQQQQQEQQQQQPNQYSIYIYSPVIEITIQM
mmetsp:Transcript_5947/g.7309  ORF Transcript_5947/g.7309 Transcript_5947/m.7309 type:complete len:80 (-) Transcript_5947:166-405(-)